MNAPGSSDGSHVSRRALLRGAGALGLSVAGSSWFRAVSALAVPASKLHGAAQPRQASAEHLLLDYRTSQPTGWPPQQHLRNGVGVTIGGHVPSASLSLDGIAYEVSLLAFGQSGNSPDPVYEGEPADATIDFKRTLQKAWGTYYAFRYVGGFSGSSAISVQSYSVFVTEPTTTRPQLGYGIDLFLVYEPDPASSDPPITADLRWIEVTNAGGRSGTEFAQRACPYYFPGGLTSVYGKPACSFYGGGQGGISTKASSAAKRASTRRDSGAGEGPAVSQLVMAESFLVLDTQRKDHAGKGIIDIYGGVKWGYQLQAVQA